MWRASQIGNIPHPYRISAGLSVFLAAAAIHPSEAFTPHPVSRAATGTAPPTAVRSTPQPAEKTFPTVTQPPKWDGKEGIELTTTKALYIGLVPADTDLIKVNLPDGIEAAQKKTTFVAVRWAGYSAISRCAIVSDWEVQEKFDKQYLPDVPNDPCGAEQLNNLKHISNFVKKINGRNKVDGALTDAKNPPGYDSTFYRNYAPPKDTVVGTPENSRLTFQDPVILDNNTRVHVVKNLFWRYLTPDSEANGIRLNPDEIIGATVDETETMSLWGFEDSGGADPTYGGTDKPDDAVRGHNPVTGNS
jgi:hypothetical protein